MHAASTRCHWWVFPLGCLCCWPTAAADKTLYACACVPAATTVSVSATLVNTGNVRLRSLAWTTSWAPAASAWNNGTTGCLLGTTGTEASASPTAEVPVGQQLICWGTYAITQDVMEEGVSKVMNASVSVQATDSLVAVPLQAGVVTTVSIPIDINPNMTVDVLDTDCIKPFRAGELREAACFVLRSGGQQRATAALTPGVSLLHLKARRGQRKSPALASSWAPSHGHHAGCYK